MFAGDCDVLEENRQVTYSLTDIQFEFVDPDRGYTLDSTSEERVSQAFAINSSGAVVPLLTSYRPYSFGRFILTVEATDSKGRSDISELKVCNSLLLYSLLLYILVSPFIALTQLSWTYCTYTYTYIHTYELFKVA